MQQLPAFAQTCSCEKDSSLILLDCTPLVFDNQAKLYWSYNCDSSWLTFKHAEITKIIFSLGDGLQGYTGRLGFSYATEYHTTFWIRNNVISGCCEPPEYYLFNKKNGSEIKNVGRLIFYSEDKKFPFVIGITNSNYDTSSVKFKGYKTISIVNVDKNKIYKIPLPPKLAKETLKADIYYPELLFSEPILKNGVVALSYSVTGKKEEKIRIDLNKYLKN
ncbi:MAG: hypothetical protein BGO70_00785 [Bacteroidetes bacterium 43-93]|nr:MAG: hypothetical protein BGO70_00785 [Bacteroidetes bacterium 43-93]